MAAVIGIGIYFAKRANKNSEAYFLGGRSLGPWVAAFSAEASDMYFAVAETAFASVSRTWLRARMDKGDPRAKKALKVTDNFDRAITTILIGTNIVHLTVAAMVTVLVTHMWGMVRRTDPDFEVSAIPEDDPATFEMLTAGKTSGVFQLESTGMVETINKVIRVSRSEERRVGKEV